MPTPRINGTRNPISQGTEFSYDPTRGTTITQNWESAGNNLTGLANSLLSQRIAYTLKPTGFKSMLSATATGAQLGYPEIIVDGWQVLANENQKELRELKRFLAMEQAYPGTIGIVMRDLDLYNQGKPQGNPGPNPAALAEASNLTWLLRRGTTHFAYSQYVIKHTTNVSNDYDANIADINIEKVYTTAQLLAEITDPGLWTFPFPGRLVYKIQHFEAPDPQTNYLWGWRKLASTETNSAMNRVEIATEYWLEQWSTIIYPPATF